MDSKPIIERAATIGRRESGVWVVFGRVVGTSVGETGVVWVVFSRVVGTIVGLRVVTGSVAVTRAC